MGAQTQQGSSPQQTFQMLMQQMAGAQNPQLGQLLGQMAGGPMQSAFGQYQGPQQLQGTDPRMMAGQYASAPTQQSQWLGSGSPYANQPTQSMQRPGGQQSMKSPGAGSSGPSTAGFGGQGGAGMPPPGLSSALGAMGGPQRDTNAVRQPNKALSAMASQFKFQR